MYGPTILVSACEPSGQLHAADVIHAVSRRQAANFVGIGGADMADAGCRLLYDVAGRSGMLLGVTGALGWALPAFWKLDRLMAGGKIDLVMLVDSPTFNLPLARRAKARGLPTLYYIAPQVWAWGAFRLNKIRRRVDKLAVILPFEQQYFRDAGIDAQFVGHPFISQIDSQVIDQPLLARLKGAAPPRVLIMPGSRRHVIKELLPLQLKVAAGIRNHFGQISLVISAWSDQAKEDITGILAHGGVKAEVYSGANATLIEAAQLVLAASGTGTLQVARAGVPLIVMYNASRWGYRLLGRHLINTPWLSLLNILASKQLVPEFMPYIRDLHAVQDAAIKLLSNQDAAQNLGRQLRRLIEQLHRPDPADNVAQMLQEMLANPPA